MNNEYWTLSNDNIFVAAHRGLSAKYPGNTLPAFEAAAVCGCDQVETDVRITSDGALVTIHDADVKATTNGSGLVRNMTFTELRELSAHEGMEEFEGVKIPSFEEFLDVMRRYDMRTLDVELKEYPQDWDDDTPYRVCDRVVDMLKAFGFENRYVLNTFSGRLHEYIAEKYPEIRRHVYWPWEYLGDGMNGDPYLGAYCCCMFGSERCDTSPAEDFAAMKARGISPWAGAGVKTKDDALYAADKGAELITCNNPDEMLTYLKELGKRA